VGADDGGAAGESVVPQPPQNLAVAGSSALQTGHFIVEIAPFQFQINQINLCCDLVARLKPLRGGAHNSFIQQREGPWPGDKIFLVGLEIKPVLGTFTPA